MEIDFDRIALLAEDCGGWARVEPVHRGTRGRWLKGMNSPSAKKFLRLAVALDVDPWCLWSIKPEKAEQLAWDVQKAMQGWRSWSRLFPPAFSFVQSIIGLTPHWPNEAFALRHFRRSWTVREFRHVNPEYDGNRYATIEIMRKKRSTHPRVYHFAFRTLRSSTSSSQSTGPDTRMWRPFGTVEISPIDKSVRLIHYLGHVQLEHLADDEQCLVETFFGRGPAEFRVASLHDFDLALDPPARKKVVRVQFPADQ
jgi:hypothetical protein